MICNYCGKEIAGEGMAFCPYCGKKLEAPAAKEEKISGETREWLDKAMKITSLPERKKVLLQAKEACPNDPAIDWELLFIGTPDPKPKRGTIDFSIIKSWVLQIYRTPGDFSAEKRDAMRRELFDSEELQTVLRKFHDPEQKQKEYLDRLCREYIEIFLKEDNRLMGNIFGLRLGRNRDKILGEAVEQMIVQIDRDSKLTAEQRQQLQDAMRMALI